MTTGARLGGLLGMIGCYSIVLAGMLDMSNILKVVGWLIFSSAIFALIGCLIGLALDLKFNNSIIQ